MNNPKKIYNRIKQFDQSDLIYIANEISILKNAITCLPTCL